jgi:hypothetical protein
VDQQGNFSPAWLAAFRQQVVPAINDLQAQQQASLQTTNPTVAQLLLQDTQTYLASVASQSTASSIPGSTVISVSTTGQQGVTATTVPSGPNYAITVGLGDITPTSVTAALNGTLGTTTPSSVSATTVTSTGPIQTTASQALNSANAGGMSYNSAAGLQIQAKTGSSYDFALLNPAANTDIMWVPTGTSNVNFAGAVTSAGEAVPTETDSTWVPTVTNLTVIGTPTYTAKYRQIGNVVFFSIRIQATTSSASTANSTSFTLPTTPASPSTCQAVNASTLSYGVGLVYTDGKCYTPTWAANNDVTLSGFYFTT